MLSDSCFEFLSAFSDAARKLAEDAHAYSSPSAPIPYGVEIDALRRASMRVADEPTDVEAGAHLLRLAASVLRYHDTPPDSPELVERERKMLELARLLDAASLQFDPQNTSNLAKAVTADGAEGEIAADTLRSLLGRLGKPARDSAMKIITDIGSATVKRLLGL